MLRLLRTKKRLRPITFSILACALVALPATLCRAEESEGQPQRPESSAAIAASKEASSPGKAEPPAVSEWLGGDLPWWEWSRMTGDWGGWRTALKEKGLTIEGANVTDWSGVASGGVRRRASVRNLLDLRFTLDSKALLNVDAGAVFARYYGFFGRSFSKYVGDIQNSSNIDTDRPRHQLAELWYEKRFFKEMFRLKVGKVDANTEFAFAENAAEFRNSSMGFSPTILTLPTYPDPAMGVNLFAYPIENLYLGFGAYDGAGQRGFATGSRGPGTFFRGLNKLFYIGELGGRWTIPGLQLPGRLGLGGWHHNDKFDRFDGGRDSSASGFYAVLDQMLWRAKSSKEDEPKGVSMYFQYGWADRHVSEIARHVGTGLLWKGAIPSRDEDSLGTAITWVRLSSASGAGFEKNHELVFETFYKLRVTPWLALKPDLQYIVNPSGARSIKNALVPTMRFEWAF